MLTFSMGKQDPLQSWPHKNTAERKDPSRGGSKNRGEGGDRDRVFQGATASKWQCHEVGRRERGWSPTHMALGELPGQSGW